MAKVAFNKLLKAIKNLVYTKFKIITNTYNGLPELKESLYLVILMNGIVNNIIAKEYNFTYF